MPGGVGEDRVYPGQTPCAPSHLKRQMSPKNLIAGVDKKSKRRMNLKKCQRTSTDKSNCRFSFKKMGERYEY
jgi:hypothetical protein